MCIGISASGGVIRGNVNRPDIQARRKRLMPEISPGSGLYCGVQKETRTVHFDIWQSRI